MEETYAGSRIVVCSCPEGHVAVSPSYCDAGKVAVNVNGLIPTNWTLF